MNIYFKHDHKCFNLRVAAVIKQNDKILLGSHHEYYTLPNESVHFGETTEYAVKRAIFDKLNVEVTITKLLSINENFFDYGDDEYHELLLVYLCEVKEDVDLTEVNENKPKENQFRFISFKDLIDLNFKPKFLLDDLKKLSNEITHNVNK